MNQIYVLLYYITPYLDQYKLFNIEQKMKYAYAIFLYKLINSQKPSYLFEELKKRSETHALQLRYNTFTIPRHKTSKFQGSFAYSAVSLLNEIITI